MNIRRLIVQGVAVPSAALAGNWLGAQLHRAVTGRPAHGIVYRHVDEQGRQIQSVPVSANFLPALLCGALGQPRWMFSFLGGFAISLVAGDALEDRLMAWLLRRMPLPTGRTGARGEHASPDGSQPVAAGPEASPLGAGADTAGL